MVQPAKHRRSHDGAEVGQLRLSAKRRAALQSLVWAMTVVVGEEEFFEHSPQMVLAQDNQMVEALPPNGPDQSLDVRILPRAVWRRRAILDPDRRDALLEHPAVDGVVVAQQTTRRLVEGNASLSC